MIILNRWAGARPIVGATLAVAQKMGRCKTCPYLSEDEMNPCGCPKIKRRRQANKKKVVRMIATHVIGWRIKGVFIFIIELE